MRKQTEVVFSHCPNYHKIINFKIEKDDFISKRIVHYYKEFVRSHTNIQNLEQLTLLDQAIGEYIQKGDFYRTLKKWFYQKKIELEESNYFLDWTTAIIELYEIYLTQKQTREPTHWL